MLERSKQVEISIEAGVELFKDLLLAVTGFAKEKYRANDPFGISTRRYIGGFIERYSFVKMFGMPEPVPLKSLHVRVNIFEEISTRARLRRQESTDFYDFDRRSFAKKSETVDGELIVNRLDKFIVLGKPGAGKTTYLKFLTLMMLDPLSQIERRRLPIFVTLREWADERVPLLDFIVQQFDTCGFSDAHSLVEKMLTEGQCIVLFDGLDEVSSDANQDDIIRQIHKFTDKYASNQVVISCRVQVWKGGFEQFTDVEINYFPSNSAEHYERAIETLLKKWDEGHSVHLVEVCKQLMANRDKAGFQSAELQLDTDSLQKLVEEYLYDPMWWEVFVLVAGMLDSADVLLLLMRQKAEEMLEEKEINELFQVAERSLLPEENKYPLALRRTIATSIVLAHDLTLARDLAQAFDITHVMDLDQAFVFARKSSLSYGFARDFAFDPDGTFALNYSFALTLIRDLSLDLKLLDTYVNENKLNRQMIQKVESYFSANMLILNCLDSRYAVSAPIREKLLHEMLLPKEDLQRGNAE